MREESPAATARRRGEAFIRAAQGVRERAQATADAEGGFAQAPTPETLRSLFEARVAEAWARLEAKVAAVHLLLRVG